MNPTEDTPSNIDTSKMTQGQREALEMTESARSESTYRSYVGDLFMGRFSLEHIYPFPLQAAEDIAAGRPFLGELAHILKNEVDSDRIDTDGEIPDVLAELGRLVLCCRGRGKAPAAAADGATCALLVRAPR